MNPPNSLLEVNAAREELLAMAHRLPSEEMALSACEGRVLAEPLVALTPLPARSASSMDGYALRYAEVASASFPFRLAVRGASMAGHPLAALEAGCACRIATGGELPQGADCVVPQEDVVRHGDEIELRRAPERGAWVRWRGEDLVEGDTAIERGTRLGPGHVCLAAALDAASLRVSRRPTVSLVCLGDELRAAGSFTRPGSVPDSNGPLLEALLARAGAHVRSHPIVRDDLELATRALTDALAQADVLVTVGGVSVGDADVTKQALERAGATLSFWRIAMKPGKPLCVGQAGAKLVVGLPGNPVSAAVCSTLFVAPLLAAMQGSVEPIPSPLPVTVRVSGGGQLTRRPGRVELLRAKLRYTLRGLEAVLDKNQASGAAVSLARSDVLVWVPADCTSIHDGDTLTALPFDVTR
jgi:molybdopterin molybdotransferase